jgi:hypothetical protein
MEIVLRPEIQKFAEQMEIQMRIRDTDGEDDWKDKCEELGFVSLQCRLGYELEGFMGAVRNHLQLRDVDTNYHVVRRSADVGNLLMMLFSKAVKERELRKEMEYNG